MKLNPVIVCNLYEAIRHLPDLSSRAGFKHEKVQFALIKPNICGLYHPSLDLLSSIISLLLPSAKSVTIGETRSMIHNPEEQFERLGVNVLLKRFNARVKTVDLSSDEWVEIRVSNPHAFGKIELPRTALDSDILINVPKVGTHSTTGLTCALKNLFCLLPQKQKYSVYHPLGMDNVIADIAQVIKPNLNIVDAGEKAILGVDALAVGVVSCRFANLDPLKVKHLRLVSEDRGERLKDFLERLNVIEV